MGPDFLEVVGLLACILAGVGVIVWIISSIEVWSEIRRLQASVREFQEFDEKWARAKTSKAEAWAAVHVRDSDINVTIKRLRAELDELRIERQS